jgi:hypothetical protein
MINTERNRALLTDLFAALGREGGVKRFSPRCVTTWSSRKYRSVRASSYGFILDWQ